MQRVLEPEVMDHPDDAEEYEAMDFHEPDSRFADAAVGLLAASTRPRIVDLGTGTGSIPLMLLGRLPGSTIVAVDLAESMLAVARRKLAATPHAERVRFVLGDVKATGLDAGFDLVMTNSVVHHMPRPLELFAEVARLASNGAAVLIRDLVRPRTQADARALVELHSGGDSDHQRRLFYDSLCAALTLEEVESLLEAAGIAGAEVKMVSDRHYSVERPWAGNGR